MDNAFEMSRNSAGFTPNNAMGYIHTDADLHIFLWFLQIIKKKKKSKEINYT